MPSTANLTTFRYASSPGAGGTVNTAVSGIMSIVPPARTVAEVATTHLSSTLHTAQPGLPKYDKATVTIQYTAALYDSFVGLSALRTYEIGFPETSGTITFDAFMTVGPAPGFTDVDELVTFDIELCVQSVPVIVVGS